MSISLKTLVGFQDHLLALIHGLIGGQCLLQLYTSPAPVPSTMDQHFSLVLAPKI